MDIEAALDEIKVMAARVVEAVDGIAAAKQALQLTALKLLVACEADSNAERELVSRLYWEVPDLPVKTDQ